MALRPSVLIDGGPRERAQLFRAALAEGRAVSVGYRKGGKLEVRDLTGCDFYYTVQHGRPYGIAPAGGNGNAA